MTTRQQKEKQNFISVDNTIAINSDGGLFHIGDEVEHDGSKNEIAIIQKFEVLPDDEIKVYTTKGHCHLDFLTVVKTNEY